MPYPVRSENTPPPSRRRRSSALYPEEMTMAQKRAEALRRRSESMEARIVKTGQMPHKPVDFGQALSQGPFVDVMNKLTDSPVEERQAAEFDEVHHGNLDALYGLDLLAGYYQKFGAVSLKEAGADAAPVLLRQEPVIVEALKPDAPGLPRQETPILAELSDQARKLQRLLVLYIGKTSKEKSTIALSAHAELCANGLQACLNFLDRKRDQLINPRHNRRLWVIAGCLAIFLGISLLVAAIYIPKKLTRGQRLLEQAEQLRQAESGRTLISPAVLR